MADKDRPTRKFSRTETFELLTNEGKSYEPEIRDLLVEFSLAYWRRELYLRTIDGEDHDGPEPEPAPEIDTGSTGTPWATGGLS